jgi:hypothetical protein
MKKMLAALLLAVSCAGAGANGPQSSEIQVLDEQGEPLLGVIGLWSRANKDDCTIYGSGCTIALPTGDYTLSFHKERSGRVGSSIGGQVTQARRSGCLRARVHVIPGQKIVCKKIGEYSCNQGAYGNLDCGTSDAARYGFKPTPADEPPSENTPPEQ